MNRQQTPNTDFEGRLLTRLQEVVAECGEAEAKANTAKTRRPTFVWRRGPRLALGGGFALAAVAAGLIVNAGGDSTSKAFAVEPQEGGGVTIKVYSPEDAAGLERALGEAGIRSQVTWLPSGMACREPHFTVSTAKTAAGGMSGEIVRGGRGKAMTIGVMTSQQWRELRQERRRGEISRFDSIPLIGLDPASFRPDQTMVISGSRISDDRDPEGGFEALLAIAEGPVEPCEPVKAPNTQVRRELRRAVRQEAGVPTAPPADSGPIKDSGH